MWRVPHHPRAIPPRLVPGPPHAGVCESRIAGSRHPGGMTESYPTRSRPRLGRFVCDQPPHCQRAKGRIAPPLPGALPTRGRGRPATAPPRGRRAGSKTRANRREAARPGESRSIALRDAAPNSSVGWVKPTISPGSGAGGFHPPYDGSGRKTRQEVCESQPPGGAGVRAAIPARGMGPTWPSRAPGGQPGGSPPFLQRPSGRFPKFP